MVKCDVKEIKKKYLKKYKGDKILEGCLPLSDDRLYNNIEEECFRKGFAYLTVEITNGRGVEIKTIPVEKVIGVRGTAFFIYNNEIVFSYYNEDNIRIGFDFNQKEYYLKYYKMPQEVSKEDLEEIVEQLLTEHYGDIYHLWMNHTDVDNFADKLDLNLNSRINLHKVYLEFCQKQYIRHNGYENPILNDKMSELLGDVEYFLGKKNYKKYVDVENYIELAE